MKHAFPESDVFYRRLDRPFPLAASARGCTIGEDETREVAKRLKAALGDVE